MYTYIHVQEKDSVLSVCVCERERDMEVYIYKCVREENMKCVAHYLFIIFIYLFTMD